MSTRSTARIDQLTRSHTGTNHSTLFNVAGILYAMTIFLIIIVCLCGSKYLLKSKCTRKRKVRKKKMRKTLLEKKPSNTSSEDNGNLEEGEESECAINQKESSITGFASTPQSSYTSQDKKNYKQKQVYKFSDTASILLAKCPPESSNKTDLSRLKRAKSVYQIGDRSRY